ncbi:glycosyltransferase family 71 protein [Sclerotinia borealis F-4128]|uniref:Glycosyltransferase family 71 protein n=1 Tax=Sclerotinia borealis (strain F-4128) TaxID=1432307 RepID=W9CCN4_SCLBF|nr:glycosyltransferase family 71 protein [Sclerotinia borealis F-4128]
MRQNRALVTFGAIIFVALVVSLLHLNSNDLSNYIPQGAQNYFHYETPPSSEEISRLNRILKEFISRPILSYDDAVSLNSQTCPVDGTNFDRNSIDGNSKKWADIPSSQIYAWREGIVTNLRWKQNEAVERMTTPSSTTDEFEKEKKGKRGIVMAAGDRPALIRARTSLRLLKSYNCTLPVEIFHFESELSAPALSSLLSDLSELQNSDSSTNGITVTIRKVEEVSKGSGWKDFQIKGAAIQQSSFDDILYLDTDSYPLRNPEYLFEGREWRDTGLLLWPDYSKSHPTNPMWRLLGQSCRNEYEGESGQVLISRTRHQDILWLIEYFALHHEEFYGFMGGDRDSFRAAALILGKSWTGPGRANAVGAARIPENHQSGGHTMLQADPYGKWMFVHANLIKHSHFDRPIWSQVHRIRDDLFKEGTTFGNIDSPNDKIGDGVKLDVAVNPRLITSLSTFEGYDEGLIAVEDWDSYEELKGFEDKWFGFGGVH